MCRPNIFALAPPMDGSLVVGGANFWCCAPGKTSSLEVVHHFLVLPPGMHGFTGVRPRRNAAYSGQHSLVEVGLPGAELFTGQQPPHRSLRTPAAKPLQPAPKEKLRQGIPSPEFWISMRNLFLSLRGSLCVHFAVFAVADVLFVHFRQHQDRFDLDVDQRQQQDKIHW